MFSKWMNCARRVPDFFFLRQQLIVFRADTDTERLACCVPRIAQQEAFAPGGPLERVMRRTGAWNEAEMERRRQREDICYTVMDDGECVHYAWVSRTAMNITEMHYTASLAPGNYWIYDCYTVPSHRGKGIFTRVLDQIVSEFFRSGQAAVWIGALDSNIASVRGIAKAGFKETGRLEKQVVLSCMTRIHISPALSILGGRRVERA